MSATYSSEIIYSYIDFDGKLVNVIKKIYINGKTKLIQQLAKIKTSQAKSKNSFMLRTKEDQFGRCQAIRFWVYPNDPSLVHIDHGDNTPFSNCAKYARQIVEAKMERMPNQWYWEDNDQYGGIPYFMNQ